MLFFILFFLLREITTKIVVVNHVSHFVELILGVVHAKHSRFNT
nr:MAG: hypothetical protein J07AB56_00780 [Candidatus Nanosalinarum sp. J07AB56]